MVPVYNRTKYLEKTLASVLAQDLGPKEMQIEVVDDCSTLNDPEPLVRRIAGDRVNFVRNSRNLGLVANFNNCIGRARGHWVHLLHTDDYLLPGFYERLKAALATRNDVGAAYCRTLFIDGDGQRMCEGELEQSTAGVLPNFIEKIGVCNRIAMPAIVVRRSVYETLGGYLPELCYTTDWQMWIRIAAHYPIWYEPAVLAAGRDHAESETANLRRAGRTYPDVRRCIDISRPLLPPDRAADISHRAMEKAALQALDLAWRSYTNSELLSAVTNTAHALRFRCSPQVVKTLLSLFVRAGRGTARGALQMLGWKGRTPTSPSKAAAN